jgi:hypothetical protein
VEIDELYNKSIMDVQNREYFFCFGNGERYFHCIHINKFYSKKKLTVHGTYTEKLQINGQIKLYTIYTNTVNRQMELAGRTNYHIYISNKFTVNYTSKRPIRSN